MRKSPLGGQHRRSNVDNGEQNRASNNEPTKSELTAFEMVDNEQERRLCRDLPVGECDAITVAYEDDDKTATARQGGHRWRARIAAACATAAILAAVLKLTLGNWPGWLPGQGLDAKLVIIEVVALSALILAIVTGQKYAWLAPRHRAELCRLAKFEFLTTPGVWQDRSRAKQWIQEKLKDITKYQGKDPLRKEITVPLPQDPSELEHQPIPPETLTHLLQYYRAKRLVPQKRFFARRVKENEERDKWPRRLAPMLFFGGVIAAGLHLVSEINTSGGESLRLAVCHRLPCMVALSGAASRLPPGGGSRR